MTECSHPSQATASGVFRSVRYCDHVRKRGVLSLLSRTFFLLLILLQAVAADLPAASRISDYQAVFIPFYTEEGILLAAIRRYNHGDDRLFLVLDPQRFELNRMTAAKVLSSRPAGDQAWRETSFFRALARQTSPPYPLQNDGLREAEHPVKGFFLTADLCPAQTPLDRGFFKATASLPQKPPLPVALMVSGLWIQRHQDDLVWLKDQIAARRLAVTWVNHSFTHPYDPVAPLEKNFLLMPKTDFTGEVLLMEHLLLEQGLTPSPFFRFPGLVSDRRRARFLVDFSSYNLYIFTPTRGDTGGQLPCCSGKDAGAVPLCPKGNI